MNARKGLTLARLASRTTFRLSLIISVLVLSHDSMWCQKEDVSANRENFALFRCALHNNSTSPNYVLITIIDDNTEEETTCVVTTDALIGAIHREYGIPYSRSGADSVIQIALSGHDRRFHFSRMEALSNVFCSYGLSILDSVRSRLSLLTNEEIRHGLPYVSRDYGSTLHAIYKYQKVDQKRAYRDALAHALLERDILCGISDVSGQLYVDRRPCGK